MGNLVLHLHVARFAFACKNKECTCKIICYLSISSCQENTDLLLLVTAETLFSGLACTAGTGWPIKICKAPVLYYASSLDLFSSHMVMFAYVALHIPCQVQTVSSHLVLMIVATG